MRPNSSASVGNASGGRASGCEPADLVGVVAGDQLAADDRAPEPDADGELPWVVEVGGDVDDVTDLGDEPGLLLELACRRRPDVLAVVHEPGRDRPEPRAAGLRAPSHQQHATSVITDQDGGSDRRVTPVDEVARRAPHPGKPAKHRLHQRCGAPRAEHVVVGQVLVGQALKLPG